MLSMLPLPWLLLGHHDSYSLMASVPSASSRVSPESLEEVYTLGVELPGSLQDWDLPSWRPGEATDSWQLQWHSCVR